MYVLVYPWVTPRFEHTQDPFRAEDGKLESDSI